MAGDTTPGFYRPGAEVAILKAALRAEQAKNRALHIVVSIARGLLKPMDAMHLDRQLISLKEAFKMLDIIP